MSRSRELPVGARQDGGEGILAPERLTRNLGVGQTAPDRYNRARVVAVSRQEEWYRKVIWPCLFVMERQGSFFTTPS